MKHVISLSYSDSVGGAARAAYRIHRALLEYGINSEIWATDVKLRDCTVKPIGSPGGSVIAKMKYVMGGAAVYAMKTSNKIIHSPAIIPSVLHKLINESDADLIHLHWVNHDMMSIRDIAKITKPVVWTLHDMWAFCGAEHVSYDFRWRDGYLTDNRPHEEGGIDLNRLVWERKIKHWKRPMHIVTPSRWLAQCVKESKLMHEWPVTVVPNPIDTKAWVPLNKAEARSIFNIDPDVSLLLFGSADGIDAYHKGYDLLMKALKILKDNFTGLQIIVFGQNPCKYDVECGFPVHYVGFLHDDEYLRIIYSAADAMVIPSRKDNLPNMGNEALACGTPVIAFDICGLPDIVEHKKNGYLANAFDVEDLADGIRWTITDSERNRQLSVNARRKAVECFDYPVVARQYAMVYQDVLNGSA